MDEGQDSTEKLMLVIGFWLLGKKGKVD